MSRSLPTELEYLTPWMEYYSHLPPDELEEGVLDTTVLEQSLLARIEGLSDSASQQLLEKDMRVLRYWVNDVGLDHSGGALFITQWAREAGGDLAEMLRQPPCTESPYDLVRYDAPVDYSVNNKGVLSRNGSETLIFCGSIRCVSWLDGLLVRLHFGGKAPKHYKGKQSKSKVAFGSVSGIKITFIENAPVPCKRIEYMLKVPGGRIHISVQTQESHFDESELEKSFSTLSVAKR